MAFKIVTELRVIPRLPCTPPYNLCNFGLSRRAPYKQPRTNDEPKCLS